MKWSDTTGGQGMAREERGTSLERRQPAGSMYTRYLGPEVPTARRVATAGGLAVASGGGITGLAVAGNDILPHFAGAVHAVEPGLIGLASAAGVAVVFNGIGLLVAGPEIRKVRSGTAPDSLNKEIRAYQKGWGTVTSWIGRVGVMGGVVMGTTTAGFDATHLVHGQAVGGMAGATEVLVATGAVALASARMWRRGQARTDRAIA